MSYEAKVLAHSISEATGVELFTLQVTFPRFILAEVNTHRVFSRNSASSRAIPPEKLIQRVIDSPFIPETFNERVKGMGVGAMVDDAKHSISRMVWLEARDEAVKAAGRLNDLGLDKSRVNRILEPFMWHTAIISSTEWDNFFALRCPPGPEADIEFPAQLEFQKLAILMREAMGQSEPAIIPSGLWHLPMVSERDFEDFRPLLSGDHNAQLLSAGRCARVSFDTHENWEEPEKSIARAEGLMNNGHMSPFEHQATPLSDERSAGNFRGWCQYRIMIPQEENRVGALEGRKNWREEYLDIINYP